MESFIGKGLTHVKNGVHLSYLPYPHTFERVVHMHALRVGVTIHFSCGDITRLNEDLKRTQPTYLYMVPRLLNRFYEAVR